MVSGLEHLFGLPSPEEADPPAVWKLAAATEAGLAPTVFLVGLLLLQLPFYARWGRSGLWGAWGQVLLSTAICVSLMTWVVMPLLTRVLRRWLYPRTHRRLG
jgi:antibiotic biosynthesis monooxygenase (ABM) superfamily enzyme